MMPRPELPPTTPTSQNVYACTLLPTIDTTMMTSRSHRLQNLTSTTESSTGQIELKKIKASVDKMASRLPSALREQVLSIVHLCIRKSEETQTLLDVSQGERNILKQELRMQVSLTLQEQKNAEVLRGKVDMLEEKVNNMKDDLEIRQHYSVRNTRFMNRLTTTNQLMIGSLDSLKINNANSTTGSIKEEPIMSESDHSNLKAIILKLTRDSYAMTKKLEEYEFNVDKLRDSLKRSEKQNRAYQRQLDEVRATGTSINIVEVQEESSVKRRSYSADERLELLLNKQKVDPFEVISNIRKMLLHTAICPTDTLDPDEVAAHLCLAEAAQATACDVVVIFLRVPFSDKILKFTPRSQTPEIVYSPPFKSLLYNVLHSDSPLRMNMIDNKTFHNEIDGCTGLLVRNVTAVALKGKINETVVGAVHFLNKNDNEPWSEVDEIICSIYADEVSTLLSACLSFSVLFKQYSILRDIESVERLFFEELPDNRSAVVPLLLSGYDVIRAVEIAAKKTIRFSQVKAFICSHLLLVHTADGMVSFIPGAIGSYPAGHSELDTARDSIGIVGHVLQSAESYVVVGLAEDDRYFNSIVDIDPADACVITCPITDINGKVLGCLQAAVDRRAYREFELQSQSGHGGGGIGVNYEGLLVRIASRLAGPLQYALPFIGKQFNTSTV